MSLLAVCLLVIFIVLNRAFSSWLLCVVFLSIFLAKHTVDVRTIVSLQGTPYDVWTVRRFVSFKKGLCILIRGSLSRHIACRGVTTH